MGERVITEEQANALRLQLAFEAAVKMVVTELVQVQRTKLALGTEILCAVTGAFFFASGLFVLASLLV
jgi:hypothetical protein